MWCHDFVSVSGVQTSSTSRAGTTKGLMGGSLWKRVTERVGEARRMPAGDCQRATTEEGGDYQRAVEGGRGATRAVHRERKVHCTPILKSCNVAARHCGAIATHCLPLLPPAQLSKFVNKLCYSSTLFKNTSQISARRLKTSKQKHLKTGKENTCNSQLFPNRN